MRLKSGSTNAIYERVRILSARDLRRRGLAASEHNRQLASCDGGGDRRQQNNRTAKHQLRASELGRGHGDAAHFHRLRCHGNGLAIRGGQYRKGRRRLDGNDRLEEKRVVDPVGSDYARQREHEPHP